MNFLINTAALARWEQALRPRKLFQQFVKGHEKPLKRLIPRRTSLHRAEAPVLMRTSYSACATNKDFRALRKYPTGTLPHSLFAIHHSPPALTGTLPHWQMFGLVLCLCLFCLPVAASQTTNPPAPAKLKISGYGLLGNRELKRILTTLELGGKKPRYFGSDFIEDAALVLSARVKRDGYLDPHVAVELRLEDGSTMKVKAEELVDKPLPRGTRATRARFRIHKGVLYHFESIEFNGLETITPKEARSYFVATEILLNIKGARVYTPTKLRSGISSLTEVLDRQGFQEAKVEADPVQTDPKTGAVRVRINVQQGPKFIVHSVREEFFYGGSTNAASTQKVYPNKPSSRLWFQDFTLNLKTNLYQHGYPDASVEIRTLSRSNAAPSSRSPARSLRGSREMTLARSNAVPQIHLELLALVRSGPQIRIGAVKFQGEKRTRPSLMARRARVLHGELLDRMKTEDGRVRLAQLGVFETVDLAYAPADEQTRDVIYSVKEGKTLTLDLLFGWGSYEQLRGGVEVQESDIWGLAHRARFRAIQSLKATSGDFTYTIPELVGRDMDLFVNGNGLRREEPTFTRLEYGGGIGLHKYFRTQALDASLRYNYQILNALNLAEVQAVASEGLTNPAVGSFILDLKHDRRDNPLYPRNGYKIFSTIETATEYLGGDANYQRVELSPSWHHRLGGGLFLNLGVSHGDVISFGSPANNLPFNKRFFPGGEDSIRGYQEAQASPRNSPTGTNALGQLVGAETYTLGTVELEQSLTPRWSLVVFSDSLGMARRIDHWPWDTGLFSVGGGIRWRTLIGPVRVEYGHNLNPRKGDPSGTLQVALGFPF